MRLLVLPLIAVVCAGATLPAADDDPTLPDWARGITITNPLSNRELARELAFSDPAVWKVVRDERGGGFVELDYDRKKYKSTYTPKHRSPMHIALPKNYPLTDLV